MLQSVRKTKIHTVIDYLNMLPDNVYLPLENIRKIVKSLVPDAEETIRYMGTLKEPWIAFKVLAAGAIMPEEGLKYAFTNGADFVCMGMYDFQIVEDANIALIAIEKAKVRQRPWMG